MKKFFRIIPLMPLSILYGMIMALRNRLFDWHILKQHSFGVLIINVGNLSMGGTGKTPHVEYLVRLFQDRYRIAVLCRGYRRKTKGFIKATVYSSAKDIGDESVQYVRKFPNAVVAVCENRPKGVRQLLKLHPEIDLIILDDSFQHRYVKPAVNILLTDYYTLYSEDYVFPAGSLREFRSGSKRADMIVVTKSDPSNIPIMDYQLIKKQLHVRHYQKLFFSYIKYLQPISLINAEADFPQHVTTIFLLTGIAKSYPLEIYLKKRCLALQVYSFSDHHQFTNQEISKLIADFTYYPIKNKVIVTTEKDVPRLNTPAILAMLSKLPIYYIPIEIAFHDSAKHAFDKILEEKIKNWQ